MSLRLLPILLREPFVPIAGLRKTRLLCNFFDGIADHQ
jgi:hypothetical protein